LISIRFSSGIGLELRICAEKELWLKILSIQYYIKIRISLVIVNKKNWLVIHCGNLKGGLPVRGGLAFFTWRKEVLK